MGFTVPTEKTVAEVTRNPFLKTLDLQTQQIQEATLDLRMSRVSLSEEFPYKLMMLRLSFLGDPISYYTYYHTYVAAIAAKDVYCTMVSPHWDHWITFFQWEGGSDPLEGGYCSCWEIE